MGIRFGVALLAGKLSQGLLKLLHRNATYLPGKIAIKLCPDFLGQIEKPETVIGVTGTNGKTTVCNMLIDILTASGENVLANRFGSNINAGIASTLLSGSIWGGKTRHRVAVFEIDERSSKLIYPYVKPKYLVCTNLFRDSIRRNAHAEYIAGILSSSIPPESKLILNGDDLIAAGIAPGNSRVYFGIDRLDTDLTECVNLICDARICPKCAAKLEYDYLRYHHIGHAHCPSCGYHSPDCDYRITNIDFFSASVTIQDKSGSGDYHMVSDSLFNLYNEVAVTAALSELGWPREKIIAAFQNVHIVESRYSAERVGDIEVITHMAKGQNPVACSRVCDYVAAQPEDKEIILMLDDVFDAKDSSENITWIYETDFEFLNSDSVKRIVIGGVRCKDYFLRLLLAGIPREKLFCAEKEIEAPELLECTPGEKIFILHELYAAELAGKVRDKVKRKIRKGEEA